MAHGLSTPYDLVRRHSRCLGLLQPKYGTIHRLPSAWRLTIYCHAGAYPSFRFENRQSLSMADVVQLHPLASLTIIHRTVPTFITRFGPDLLMLQPNAILAAGEYWQRGVVEHDLLDMVIESTLSQRDFSQRGHAQVQ